MQRALCDDLLLRDPGGREYSLARKGVTTHRARVLRRLPRQARARQTIDFQVYFCAP